MLADLHTHTNFSDGSTNIEELPFLAQKANLTHLAITDHDTIKAIEFAQNNPIFNNVTLVPGVELTCFDEKRGRRVHLLCYYPKLTDDLVSFCNGMEFKRNEANLLSIAELEQLYPQFTKQAALKFSQSSGVIYKTHLIRVLYELGYTDGIYKDLFKELFGFNGGKVLHEPEYSSLTDVIKMAKNTGGVIVLAHPSVYKSVDLAKELAQNGDIDGVEINHPRNTQEDKNILLNIAKKYNLIVTGGSDFHGMHMSKPTPLGSYTTDDENISRIIKIAQKRKLDKISG